MKKHGWLIGAIVTPFCAFIIGSLLSAWAGIDLSIGVNSRIDSMMIFALILMWGGLGAIIGALLDVG